MLKLNTDKTELLVLNANHRPWPAITSVSVCDDVFMPSLSARNIGVVFDSNLFMKTHLDTACKAALFHLCNLSRICKYLSTKSTEILVHALITSKIDFCNAILYGAPENLLQKLQGVQNCVARLVCLKSKYECITPLLQELHWLPVEYRIEFKILLVTFKCLNNVAPYYLQELINVYKPKWQLRSSSKNYL